MTKATVVVEYGDSSTTDDDFCVLELDGSQNLDDEGEERTRFNPGDPVYLLVHTGPDYQIKEITATNGLKTDDSEFDSTLVTPGSLVNMGAVTLTRTQDIDISSDEDISLTYYPAGAVSIDSQSALGLNFSLSGRTLTPAADYDAKIHVSYGVEFTRFCFYPPTFELSEDQQATFNVHVDVEAAG